MYRANHPAHINTVVLKPLAPGVRAAGDVQQRQFKSIARVGQGDTCYQVAGAYRNHCFGFQPQLLGSGPCFCSKLYSCIKVFRCKVELPNPGRQVDRDLGVLMREIGQAWHQPLHPETGQNGQVQRAARRVQAQFHRRLCDLVQRLTDVAGVGFRLWGQCQAFGFADEQ